MSALTLTPRALYEEVAELLRQRIFRRELEPGCWIDELKIAGISRTPLREALKVLAAEGLVTMKVRRGAYVTEMSEKDLRDVYHLLSLLESDAAGVVARTASAEDLRMLEQLHAELEAARGERDRFFAINERFHMRLLELSEPQEGVLNVAFRLSDEEALPLLDLKDLQALLNFVAENAEAISGRPVEVKPLLKRAKLFRLAKALQAA